MIFVFVNSYVKKKKKKKKGFHRFSDISEFTTHEMTGTLPVTATPTTSPRGFLKDAVVGASVGLLDVAFLWPFVVVACRREAGAKSTMEAIRRGKLWAGWQGALSMLIPYCIAIEGLNDLFKNMGGKSQTVATSLVVSLGLQPIEKYLVMSQLLQMDGKKPFHAMGEYVVKFGPKRLFGGFVWLWSRETVYVAAVSVLNPALTSYVGKVNSKDDAGMIHAKKSAVAFGVGFGAGMISAPLQTLNVLKKDEASKGFTLTQLLRIDEATFRSKTTVTTLARRLFFGSASRSVRTGAAGVLWFNCRHIVNEWK